MKLWIVTTTITLLTGISGVAQSPASPKPLPARHESPAPQPDAKVSGVIRPKDVDGWGKIKWGMTLAEAKAAYDSAGKIKVADLELAVYPTSAAPDLHVDSKPVAKIELSCIPRYLGSSFNTLRILLIEKYGLPVNDELRPEDGANEHQALWIFPSTAITLTQRGTGTGLLTLTYQMVDKSALGVL